MTSDEQLQLGWQHHAAGRWQEAETIYRMVLSREPHPLGFNLLGLLAYQTGHLPEAIELLQKSVLLSPNFSAPHNNLGLVLMHAGRRDEALVALRRAVELEPASVSFLCNLGMCLNAAGRLDESVDALRRATQMNPADHVAHLNLATPLTMQARLDESIAACRKASELQPPGMATALSTMIYTMQFHPAYDAEAIRTELRVWNERFAVPLRGARCAHANVRDPEKRLKVGYVSPDFRDHVVGRNIVPLLREHDRERFEIFCYSSVGVPDAVTQTMQSFGHTWRTISRHSDEAVAEMIRQDGIDVLVDLALHMGGNRLPVFARQPAPVQATFAGYPGSTGLETIQYRITDPHLDPPGGEEFGSERAIRLPHSFWCYEPDANSPEPGPLPAMHNRFVTFASFNNFAKVNERVLKLWASVMRGLESSRLIILTGEGSHRRWAMDVLEAKGVAHDRVEFVHYASIPEYLAMHQRVDVAFDSFPYGAHSTGLDAFWMGVPVPTIAGTMPVGRAGVSHLNNLNLPELIATGEAQYVQITTELCRDLPRLAELRAGLRERMRASPLMDARGFARGIEGALRDMWREWCTS